MNRALTLGKFRSTASYEQGSDIRKFQNTGLYEQGCDIRKIPKHCLL
jgi:hypothetical protein